MSVVREMLSRKRLLPLLLMIVVLVYWYYSRPAPLVTIEGQTFGSIAWHIKYKDKQQRNFKPAVDSILMVFNHALSHYIPDSELSLFNHSDGSQSYKSPFFYPVLEVSKQVYEWSHGAYNPAVMPLVNAWGFGPQHEVQPDSAVIDSLLQFTDFNLVEFDYNYVRKKDPRVQLDFSASAKGYAVDIIANFLRTKGITDYFVEIGGEVVCAGTNARGEPWKIGIIDPASDILNQRFIATVQLTDRAVATSANNFNYRVVDGKRYSHTIDPVTGYPVQRNILSASVFADECLLADALATACMVMGMEPAKEMLARIPEVDALLIYTDKEGKVAVYMTEGIKPFVSLIDQPQE